MFRKRIKEFERRLDEQERAIQKLQNEVALVKHIAKVGEEGINIYTQRTVGIIPAIVKYKLKVDYISGNALNTAEYDIYGALSSLLNSRKNLNAETTVLQNNEDALIFTVPMIRGVEEPKLKFMIVKSTNNIIRCLD